MQRRMHDSRFSTRYFVGYGLDVGGGHDSLALFVELFPLIKNVVIYDVAQGDAQTLANVDDQSFDFLFSSHCLEHTRDAEEALANWIRVVRPGGHLIISVPDEDLYEQGTWPSTFNADHKITFTICKKASWSPVSVNVFDLICKFCDRVKPLSVTTIDHAYRFRLPRFDQTLTPLSECAIEFVLKKL
jgi:SAM-dependent methyltransferase